MAFEARYGDTPMHYEPKSKSHYTVFGYGEWVDYCARATKSETAREESSKRKASGDEPWEGTESWEQAIDYARHGWDAGIRDLKDHVETDSTLINVEHALVGHSVDVGRFLTGVPDNMVTFYDDSYRNKAPITVYVKLTYTSEISGEQAMEYCGKILETIALLNRTFNVRLVGVFWSQHDKVSDSLVLVNIKDTDERFVLNNLAFSFNPANFRRFWFRFLESSNYWNWGYGRSPHGGFGKGKIGKALVQIQPPNEQILFLPDIYDRKNMNPTDIVAKAVKEQEERKA